MIVCSCMRISDRDIEAAIAWMRAADPHTLITPGKVYRALGKAPDCGGCIRLFVAQMRRSALLEVPAAPAAPDVPAELRQLRRRLAEEG
jgi:bacterioferritin-associated ferredoxin